MARRNNSKQNNEAQAMRYADHESRSGSFGGQPAGKISRSPDRRSSQAESNGLTADRGHGVTSASEG